VTTTRGGQETFPGPHRSPSLLPSLREPETAGKRLASALQAGYQPSLSTIPYLTPPSGACAIARNAWISQAVYAITPDLLIHLFDPTPLTKNSGPALHAAHAMASALTNPNHPLATPVRAAWGHALDLLTAQEPRMRIGLHLATLGNPKPLIARYSELQPYAHLDPPRGA
jgi:hypothetical protein